MRLSSCRTFAPPPACSAEEAKSTRPNRRKTGKTRHFISSMVHRPELNGRGGDGVVFFVAHGVPIHTFLFSDFDFDRPDRALRDAKPDTWSQTRAAVTA